MSMDRAIQPDYGPPWRGGPAVRDTAGGRAWGGGEGEANRRKRRDAKPQGLRRFDLRRVLKREEALGQPGR